MEKGEGDVMEEKGGDVIEEEEERGGASEKEVSSKNDDNDEEHKGIDDEQRTKYRHDKSVREETGTLGSNSVESSPARTSGDDTSIKIVRYSDYKFVTIMDEHPNLSGSFTVKSSLGNFNDFRKMLKAQRLEKFFKSSAFGIYLDLPEKLTQQFQMKLVYELLERRILSKRTQEFWINFCGMPLHFGMKEFAIMTGLNCHLIEDYHVGKMSSKVKNRQVEIFEKAGRTFKRDEMMTHLESDSISRDVKKSLCLVFFVHCILLGKDLNTKTPAVMVLLSADRKAFCAHAWGRECYELTVEYLLKAVDKDKKTKNLYGFPWAFMCWAFEAIPHLRKKLKIVSDSVTSPRLIRWMSAVNDHSVNANDLFNPPEDSIVHPWLVPTSSEMEMRFLTEFVPLELTEDEEIEKLEKDLDGFVTIKRDTAAVEKDFDPSMALAIRGDDFGESSQGVDGDNEREGACTPYVNIGDASGVGGSDVGGSVGGSCVGGRGGFSAFVPSRVSGGKEFSPTGENVENPPTTPFSKMSLCACKCEICDQWLKLMNESIQSLEKTVKSFMAKRGVRPSRKISSPYTPIVNKRKKLISKAIESAKGKRAAKSPTVMPTIERQPVDIYKHASSESYKEIKAILKAKDPWKKSYTMHDFNFKYFDMMTDIQKWWEDRHVDEILCLMRLRHTEYPHHYDPKDIILNLDFPNYFKSVYEALVEESSKPGSISLKERIEQFIFDDYYLNFCKGGQPFPGGVPWHGAKRLFTYLNLGKNHFVALEFLIEDGKINVYDCNMGVYSDEKFVALMMPIFDHLPDKLLNRE